MLVWVTPGEPRGHSRKRLEISWLFRVAHASASRELDSDVFHKKRQVFDTPRLLGGRRQRALRGSHEHALWVEGRHSANGNFGSKADATLMFAMGGKRTWAHAQPRNLQRKLNRRGLTIAGLLDETRRSLATLYLRSPARTVSEVADLVGYSSVSSFSRWFTDQLGVSPSNWRRNDRTIG